MEALDKKVEALVEKLVPANSTGILKTAYAAILREAFIEDRKEIVSEASKMLQIIGWRSPAVFVQIMADAIGDFHKAPVRPDVPDAVMVSSRNANEVMRAWHEEEEAQKAAAITEVGSQPIAISKTEVEEAIGIPAKGKVRPLSRGERLAVIERWHEKQLDMAVRSAVHGLRVADLIVLVGAVELATPEDRDRLEATLSHRYYELLIAFARDQRRMAKDGPDFSRFEFEVPVVDDRKSGFVWRTWMDEDYCATSDIYETREEAIAAGIAAVKAGETRWFDTKHKPNGIYTGYYHPAHATQYVPDMVDALFQQADGSGEMPDGADSWPDASEDEKHELQVAVEKLVGAWADKHKLHPGFGPVTDEQSHIVEDIDP